MSKSSSSQSSSADTFATDNRKAVGDSGILAESGSAVTLANTDARDFSDHSVFSVDASDNSDRSDHSVQVDSRDFSDHSVFSASSSQTDNTYNTDSRDFSDRSTFNDNSHTTVNAADAEVLKATAAGAFTAANLLASQSTELFDAALKFGDAAAARAAEAQNASVEQLGKSTANALGLANAATALVAENAKSADQQTIEKIIYGAVVAFGLAVLAYVFRSRRSSK